MFQRGVLKSGMTSQTQMMVHRAVGNELEECLALCSQNVNCNQILYTPEGDNNCAIRV